MSLSAGTKLGPYEILAPLGAGGMGEVYQARDSRLERTVAVKVLPERLAEDPDALSRFVREAKAVAALSHPNILAIHDFGHEGKVAYAVSELLEGETLREALSSGPLSARKAREYGVQIALGLAAAHEKGIVHRDLKPDNIFITRDERLKILDFGLAKPGAGSPDPRDETQSPTVSGFTEPGTVMGTVGYMSPEQVRGVPVDQRSDIFAFGTVLYEMLTGKRAFQRETAAETMTAILKEEPREAADSVGADALPLLPVLRHCLEKKPEARFQSAKDLAFALETASVATSSAVDAVRPALKRSSILWRSLGIAALVCGAAVAGYLLNLGRTAAPAPDWADATLTPLTTDPGYEGEPTFSPDGQTIAYVADRDGNFEIYLQQISGGPALNLTRDPAADIQPAFSPDGREIAFVSNRSSSSDIFNAAPGLPLVGGDIWVMPALGGPARRIVENGYCPSWTPDGAGLLYVHGSFGTARIARVSASGGDSRDLPINEDASVSRYFFPSLSADGRWLLFQKSRQIEVVSAKGGKARMLAEGESPAWGPRSTSVLYTNDTPGKSRTLWRAPFSLARGEPSGPPRPLTFGRGADIGAAVSRDGTSIAFAAIDESLNLEELPFDAEAGRVTGLPRELTSGNNHVEFFDPSPDGKAVVLSALRGASSHLWRIDPPAAAVELTRDPAFSETNPEWSPLGEIAFSRSEAGAPRGGQALWIMKADGTSPRRVIDYAGDMRWLPDGSAIIHRGEALLHLDPGSGGTTPIPGVKARGLHAVDRQGQWLAYVSLESGPLGVAAVAVAGGTPRAVAEGLPVYHPFFSPSGRWMYFQTGHKNLFRIPGPVQAWAIATPEKVTDFTGVDLYIENPRISLDGSKLFYARGRRTGDIYILHLGTGAQGKAAR